MLQGANRADLHCCYFCELPRLCPGLMALAHMNIRALLRLGKSVTPRHTSFQFIMISVYVPYTEIISKLPAL
jgi:hypothetical protein